MGRCKKDPNLAAYGEHAICKNKQGVYVQRLEILNSGIPGGTTDDALVDATLKKQDEFVENRNRFAGTLGEYYSADANNTVVDHFIQAGLKEPASLIFIFGLVTPSAAMLAARYAPTNKLLNPAIKAFYKLNQTDHLMKERNLCLADKTTNMPAKTELLNELRKLGKLALTDLAIALAAYSTAVLKTESDPSLFTKDQLKYKTNSELWDLIGKLKIAGDEYSLENTRLSPKIPQGQKLKMPNKTSDLLTEHGIGTLDAMILGAVFGVPVSVVHSLLVSILKNRTTTPALKLIEREASKNALHSLEEMRINNQLVDCDSREVPSQIPSPAMTPETLFTVGTGIGVLAMLKGLAESIGQSTLGAAGALMLFISPPGQNGPEKMEA